MDRVERLAAPRLRAVTERQFDVLDLPVRLVVIDLYVGDGHPAGGRLANVVTSINNAGTLVVRCELDVGWYEAVHRRRFSVVDDQFVLDIKDDQATYVHWEPRNTHRGAYPFGSVRHATLEMIENQAHLGPQRLGPSPDREGDYLVEWRMP